MSVLSDSPHSKALAQLYPKEMDAEQNAVARVLDDVLASADTVYDDDILPSSGATDGILTRWEDTYGLSGDGTTADRWAAVKTAWAAQPGISAADYVALAKSLGYMVRIPDPPRMFRAGVSRAGQPVYDADEQYTWTVHVDAFEEAGAALVAAFEAQKIPFTVIRWIWRTPPLQMSMALETQATDPVETGVQIALGLETQATDPVGTSLQTTFALEDA